VSETRTNDDVKANVLVAALPDIAFDGWIDAVLRKACEKVDVDVKEMKLLYPRGALDLLEDYSKSIDEKMKGSLRAADLPSMKIREKITFAILTRIEALQENREASLRAANLLALPTHSIMTARLLSQTVDLAWRGIGDTSTDFNFYTKRGTLSLVYTSTLFAWMSDETEDLSETKAFLDRRIENVMQFERAKADVKKRTGRFPNPAEVLAKLRYAGSRFRS
jgi:ubiquinone biosynthesis protein COQ9